MDLKTTISDLRSRLSAFARSRKSEDKVGLYITVIFHLTVIIVLLAYGLDSTMRKEESFVLDFSKQEEIERVEKERAFKEDISRKLDRLIEMSRHSSEPVRNIAVDAGSALKDDRGTDVEELYREAERIAKELKRGQELEDATDETVEMQHQKKQEKKDENQKEYSGPSVVSYNLDGRKASNLKIPAYRCYGSGDVTVIITVDNSGRVVNAKVLEEVSSSDPCLCSFAVRAARNSRFSSSTTAPPRQSGEILYRFVAQ